MTEQTDNPCSGIGTVTQDEYIENHKTATNVDDAHPIDKDILHKTCTTKMGPLLLSNDLAAIQAVVSKKSPLVEDNSRYYVEKDNHYAYAQVNSAFFYHIASQVADVYDTVIEVENIEQISEVHTRQYLRDIHGYEGDFGNNSHQSERKDDARSREHDITLCSAQNYAQLIRDEEPSEAHYGYVDSRGFVFKLNTHNSDRDQT